MIKTQRADNHFERVMQSQMTPTDHIHHIMMPEEAIEIHGSGGGLWLEPINIELHIQYRYECCFRKTYHKRNNEY